MRTRVFTGGGILVSGGRPIIESCQITDNHTSTQGGGISLGYYTNSALKTQGCIIRNSLIAANTSGWAGALYGIISLGAGEPPPTVEASNCVLQYNSGAAAIFYLRDYSADLRNCLIVKNSSSNACCRLYQLSGAPLFKFSNCTIANSGLYLQIYSSGELALCNSIVWTDDGNVEISAFAGVQAAYCDIFGGRGGIDTNGVATVAWGPGNLQGDPLFADMVNDDYHLRSQGWRWDPAGANWAHDAATSPGIDTGNPGSGVGSELLHVPADPGGQFGVNRRIDMGYYGGTAEASLPPPLASLRADLDNSGAVDLADLALYCMGLSPFEGPGDLNHDGTLTAADLAIFAEDWLKP